MSATNRGAVRNKDDSYYTPDALALECCRVLARDVVGTSPRCILEPSSGGGAFVRAADTTWPAAEIAAVDVNPGQWVQYVMPFESYPITDFDLIVGNPPYLLAEQHIRLAMSKLERGGVLAFLLRVNFLGSRARAALWKDHPISSFYVIRPRPSFTGGQSDATEYALFVWGGPKLPVQWIDWDNKRRRAA